MINFFKKGAKAVKIKSVLTRPFFLLFFSAVLSALPLTFSGAFLLSWVSFVPLFYVITTNRGDKFRQALGRGFLFGFIYHVCIYYWFIWFYPLDYVNFSNGASIAFVILAWFGISALHGTLWCIPFVGCYLASKLVKNKLFLSVVAILGIIAAQKLTAVGELSFPWARVSLGQYKATSLIQLAAIFGIDGVDILLLLVNALITLGMVYPPKKRVVVATCAFTLFLGNWVFGLVRLNTNDVCGKEFTILTAQASVPQNEKWSSKGDKICYDIYTALTKQNITEGVDLIIWPESAIPVIYEGDETLDQYETFSQEMNTPILAGIILGNAQYNTNNTVLIDHEGLKSTYTKRQLVPFGEYMPYASVLSRAFPMLTELNIVEDDYLAGTDSAIMEINGGKIGNIICFESTYQSLTRQSTLDGAELMIEATNDSWLETSPAMYQHLAHGTFRSIENGRYLVRSANSGISAVIDDKGNIKSTLGINERGAIVDTVQFNTKQTLYTKIGNVISPSLAAITLIWFVILLLKRKKASNG